MAQFRGSASYIWCQSDVLGQGATGSVYKARHKRTGEMFAVKTFNPQSRMRPPEVQRREFEVCKKLKHENIVRLLAIEEESHSQTKSPVLVMELCTGGSLFTIIDQPQNAFGIPEEEFLHVLHDVASGMKHLRDQGIVHRDVKPGNILKYVKEDGTSVYKLTDFGAARELDEDQHFMSLYGTEEYLYPDMYERAVLHIPTATPFNATVDLWSLGVTLYHVATGQLPFKPYGGRSNRQTMHEITTNKASGVISGVQHTPDGPIAWGRELPYTCQLSLGLKDLVTPLLAGLMECNPSLMWTFEKFFAEVNNITNRKVVYVFNSITSTLATLFMDPKKQLIHLKESIAKQTDIPATNQLLLWENELLHGVVKPLEPIDNYPSTSTSKPFYLFYTHSLSDSLDFPALETLQLPHLPQKVPHDPDGTYAQKSYLDTDSNQAKQGSGIMFYCLRVVEDFHHRQNLLCLSARSYLYLLVKDIEHLRSFAYQFKNLTEELGKRIQSSTDGQLLQLGLLHAAASPNNHNMEEVTIWQRELDEFFLKQRSAYQEIVANVNEVCKHTETYNERVVINRELDCNSIEKPCCGQARCTERVGLIADEIQQCYVSFKRDKLRRQPLNSNETQLHNFEKHKMGNSCNQVVSLVQDECYQRMKNVFKTFGGWCKWATKVRRRVEKMESQLSSLADTQASMVEELDRNDVSYKHRLDGLLSTLGLDIGLPVNTAEILGSDPTKEFVICNRDDIDTFPEPDMQRNIPTQKTSFENVKPVTKQEKSERSKVLVKRLNQDLQSLKGGTDSMRDSLQQNNELLRELQALVELGVGTEPDASSAT